MKRQLFKVIIHIIFWSATTVLMAANFSIESHNIEIVNGVETITILRNRGLVFQILVCTLIAIFLFYGNSKIISRLNINRDNRKSIWLIFIFLTLAFILTNIAIQLQVYGEVPPLPKQIAFGIIAFHFAVSIAYGLAKLWYDNQRYHHKLILDKKQTELSLLRNQLQPHFLFNALNNLLSMVNPIENQKLANSFERLSQLLRYVIDETQSDKVSIAKEIAFIKNYIELQQLRYSENEVVIDFKIIGEYDTQLVEPGLYINFVENAFKYGAEPEKTSTINITFDLSKHDSILFKIKNKIMLKNPAGNGTGIETTRKRLELIYPKKHKLTVSQAAFFSTELYLETL